MNVSFDSLSLRKEMNLVLMGFPFNAFDYAEVVRTKIVFLVFLGGRQKPRFRHLDVRRSSVEIDLFRSPTEELLNV
jgi:hypothetical protein